MSAEIGIRCGLVAVGAFMMMTSPTHKPSTNVLFGKSAKSSGIAPSGILQHQNNYATNLHSMCRWAGHVCWRGAVRWAQQTDVVQVTLLVKVLCVTKFQQLRPIAIIPVPRKIASYAVFLLAGNAFANADFFAVCI